jgi:hypothetical protein
MMNCAETLAEAPHSGNRSTGFRISRFVYFGDVADDDVARTLLARMQALGHIRLARGVVGKTSVVAGIALLVLGGIAWRIDAASLPMMAAAVVVAFFVYLAAILWFAHRHPEQALLEGAEIIQYQQLQMAARQVPEAPPLKPTTPQQLPPGALEE